MSERPKRIQLRRTAGWWMPPNTVAVHRSTQYGNPFCVGAPIDMRLARKWGWKIGSPGRQAQDGEEAVRLFTVALGLDAAALKAIRETLQGKNLACWCPLDQPCHADVLLRIANKESP